MISFFGEVHNPWGATRVAGGSSGGSAASVAALGIRRGRHRPPVQSACLPPTVELWAQAGFDQVSARGVIPLSPSYDHVLHHKLRLRRGPDAASAGRLRPRRSRQH
jgi:hypothetical protein